MIKKNVLNELMMEEGQEREVLYEFGFNGKFKVYEPGSEFRSLIEELVEQAKNDDSFELSDEDSLRAVFASVTNLPDDFPELLEKENFSKIYSRPKRVFKQMAEAISQLATEEVNMAIKRHESFNNMPNSAKRRLLEKYKSEKK